MPSLFASAHTINSAPSWPMSELKIDAERGSKSSVPTLYPFCGINENDSFREEIKQVILQKENGKCKEKIKEDTQFANWQPSASGH